MTNREKFLAAFTLAGSPQTSVVCSYEDILLRDQWFHLTDVPWYYRRSGIVTEELRWISDYQKKTGLEWLSVASAPTRAERSARRFVTRSDGVWRVNAQTREESQLLPPVPGGTNTHHTADRHFDLDKLPTTRAEIEALIPEEPAFDRDTYWQAGRHDVVTAIRANFDLVLYSQIPSPLWSLYGLLGYEGLMLFLIEQPELAAFAGQRLLRNLRQQIRKIAALGADAVWIEECLTDQLSPRAFAALNVPLVQEVVAEIRAHGMKSIYYYCGNPNDRIDLILTIGADAIHFEEGKKGFVIDIAEIAARVNRRCVLFGNVDALGLLTHGTPAELRAEIQRQLAVGRQLGGRFILSTGSPFTPATTLERVRLYSDLGRE